MRWALGCFWNFDSIFTTIIGFFLISVNWKSWARNLGWSKDTPIRSKGVQHPHGTGCQQLYWLRFLCQSLNGRFKSASQVSNDAIFELWMWWQTYISHLRMPLAFGMTICDWRRRWTDLFLIQQPLRPYLKHPS